MVNKVLLVGPRLKNNPGGTGVCLGFESLIKGMQEYQVKCRIVNTNPFGNPEKCGAFAVRKCFEKILVVLQVWIQLFRVHTIYMTIASSHLGFLRDTLIIWLAFLLKRKIILHLKGGGYKAFYNDQPKFCQQIIKKTVSRATYIIVLGELLKQQFDFVDCYKDKVKVVPNGLTFGLPADQINQKKLPKNKEPLRILYLSNLIPSKGYNDLLDAMALLKKQGFNVRCDFCGAFRTTVVDRNNQSSQERKNNFYQQISRLNLQSEVTYHGTVQGKVKQQFLENAHVFILPTYYPWEGQPISIIEALAFATPIISTQHGGIPEELIEGYNGLFVESQNPDDIAEKIKKLVLDPAEYTRMSHNARKHFEENFTREKHLAHLIAIISNVSEKTLIKSFTASEKNPNPN